MVQGLDKLNRRWAAIPAKVKAQVRREMEKQAQDIVDDMYSTIQRHITGDLGGSIGWTWGEAPKGTMTIGKVGGKEYGAMRITIYAGGTDAFYARFVEFGTVKNRPKPFFFPVWRARRKKAKAGIRRAIKKGISGG
jgi:HK97 gp10 family phage protein